MEEERAATRYWCHECSRVVNPILEVESIKCSLCNGGFMEEMNSAQTDTPNSERSVPSWAPILLTMMNTHNERGRVILVNRLNPTIVVQSGSNPLDSSNTSNQFQFQTHAFGDYFLGPGLELEQLIQHLAETDPNRYGTPPAQKEAVEAMPTVKIEENSIQCSVCLDDFEIGTEAREMPCKHMFHGECILPWLELHSSCPVCRYQLPADESKINREQQGSRGDLGNGISDQERRFSFTFPWPFSGLFSRSNNLNSDTVAGSESQEPRGHEADNQEDI